MVMKLMINGEVREASPQEIADVEAVSRAMTQPSLEQYQRAVQQAIDRMAQGKQFNDGVTLASYAASTVAPWREQAQAFVAWRDAVWQYSYSELAKVESGARPQPTVEDFLLEIPEIIWP